MHELSIVDGVIGNLCAVDYRSKFNREDAAKDHVEQFMEFLKKCGLHFTKWIVNDPRVIKVVLASNEQERVRPLEVFFTPIEGTPGKQ